MNYLTFKEVTKSMTHKQRGEFFHSLSESDQNEIMSAYSMPVTHEFMLLEIRYLRASEITEEEPDNAKRLELLKSLAQLEAIYDYERKKLGL